MTLPENTPPGAYSDLARALDQRIAANFDEQISFVQRLIRARSANPFLPDTSDSEEPIELAVAEIIEAELSTIGLAPQRRGVSAARPNILAEIRGVDANPARPRLILNGHMDTVLPVPQWTRDPFGAEIDSGRLYGLGALDMKASLSMFVFLARALREAGITLAGDLLLTFVVDEEPGAYSRFGSWHLLENGLRGTAAIVAEPMNHNVTIGHRGGYRFRLTVHGEAAHTGLLAWERGEKGINAIVEMTRAVRALTGLELPYDDSPAFPGRRPVVTFPTLIEGGSGINVVPQEAIAYGDMRLLPGVDEVAIENLIRARLNAVPNLSYTLQRLLYVPPVEIDPAHPLVDSLARHTHALTGQEPSKLGCGPWNDGWMFITRGIPAICGFGPNGDGVHGPDEYVLLDSLHTTTRILARAVLDYLTPHAG